MSEPGALDRAMIRLVFGGEPVAEVSRLERGVGSIRMARHAAKREQLMLRFRLTAGGNSWRHGSPLLLGTVRERATSWLTAGAVLMPSSAFSGSLKDLMSAAGFEAASDAPAIGADGSLRLVGQCDGEQAVLRVGRPGQPSDPRRGAVALDELTGLPCVPRLLGVGVHDVAGHGAPDATSGTSATWAYTVEQRMSGRPVTSLTSEVVTDLREWLTLLSRHPVLAGTDATRVEALRASLAADAGLLAHAAPEVADPIGILAGRLQDAEAIRPVPLHGDVWARNLLRERGALTGVVDWDGFCPVGPAGVDLVHALAVDERLRRRTSMGVVAASRSWTQPRVASPLVHLLQALGIPWSPADLEVVGIAWWLTMTAASVRRLPTLSTDLGWVWSNVVQPTRALVT
jgi:hypothetical protein